MQPPRYPAPDRDVDPELLDALDHIIDGPCVAADTEATDLPDDEYMATHEVPDPLWDATWAKTREYVSDIISKSARDFARLYSDGKDQR